MKLPSKNRKETIFLFWYLLIVAHFFVVIDLWFLWRYYEGNLSLVSIDVCYYAKFSWILGGLIAYLSLFMPPMIRLLSGVAVTLTFGYFFMDGYQITSPQFLNSGEIIFPLAMYPYGLTRAIPFVLLGWTAGVMLLILISAKCWKTWKGSF